MSPKLVGIVGRLVIGHLSFIAGSAHRSKKSDTQAFIPTYLDEFASFACPEFADLISKARSAGIALHFSHQSVGDLADVQLGFMNRISDNSATKIILRINDPDTADMMSRTFGTIQSQKITKKVTNAEDSDLAEMDGAGSLRETREFRASPDLLKTLPTGVGSVLVAHGADTPGGASAVFKIRFPRLWLAICAASFSYLEHGFEHHLIVASFIEFRSSRFILILVRAGNAEHLANPPNLEFL